MGIINAIPEDTDILADKGFIGIDDMSNHQTFVPKKKPKNDFLTPEEKEDNALISSIRIKLSMPQVELRDWVLLQIFLEENSAPMIDLPSFPQHFGIFTFNTLHN